MINKSPAFLWIFRYQLLNLLGCTGFELFYQFPGIAIPVLK
jgi:hypothetical protein